MFEPFQKIARLSRRCTVTEKIDGTNAQIQIVAFDPNAGHPDASFATAVDIGTRRMMFAGSRTRYITPGDDNFGFARWVNLHAEALWALGEGQHFGEWWGQGIQRGYGLAEKRFSLFNTARWGDHRDREKFPLDRPACCGVVPVLYEGLFTTDAIDTCIDQLRTTGSMAVPGFMKPEGIVIFHSAAGILFKKTLEKDTEWKGNG